MVIVAAVMLRPARPAVPSALALALAVACSGGSGASPADVPPLAGPGSAAPVPPAPDGGSPAAAAAGDGPCSSVGFCWLAPDPQGATLTSVWAASATEAWATGAPGTLVRWTSGGGWSAVDTGTGARLYAVWGRAPGDVWAVGEAILHFDGASWREVRRAPAGETYRAIHGDASGLWVVGTAGLAAHHDGATWTDAPIAGAADRVLTAVRVLPGGEAWTAASPGAGVWRFAGGAWRAVGDAAALQMKGVNAIWGAGADDVWVAGEGDALSERSGWGHHLHHWDGTAWTAHDVPGAERAVWSGLSGTGRGDVWVVGDAFSGEPRAARWDGAAWAELAPAGSATALTAIDLGAEGGFAVGVAGGVARIAGGAWTALAPGGRGSAKDAGALGGGIWIPFVDPGGAGPLTRVARWDGAALVDGPALDDVVYGVAPTADGALWAGTLESGLARWDGLAWTPHVGGSDGAVAAVWASGPDDVWGVGDGRAVHWDGAALRTFALDATHLGSVWGSGPGDVWAAGDVGRLFHWDGAAWAAVPLPVAGLTNAVWGGGATDVWVVGHDGLALHFDGVAWRQVETGTAASLQAVTGDGAGRVWVAGWDGTVLEWSGEAFRALDSGTSDHLDAIAWDAAAGLFVAGEGGAVLRRAP